MKENKVLEFGWGDTRGLREILCNIYNYNFTITNTSLRSYGYPPADGLEKLTEQLKRLTKRLTGINFKYICITAGCTHSVNASMHVLKSKFVTYKTPYYPIYPDMVRLLNKVYVDNDYLGLDKTIIADSPSNPLGIIGLGPIRMGLEDNLIWDGAYHSPTYGMKLGIAPFSKSEVDIFCGSVSKLIGLNGLRIGWTATNTKTFHDDISEYVKNSVCGVTLPAQDLLIEIFNNEEYLEEYFTKSALLIEDNKQELLKLKTFFGSDKIPEYGMFGFFEVDQKMLNTISNANVVFTNGEYCGSPGFVRINLGNTKEMTKEMVKRILKEDRRK